MSVCNPEWQACRFWSLSCRRSLALSSTNGALDTPEAKREVLQLRAGKLYIVAVQEMEEEDQHLVAGEFVS